MKHFTISLLFLIASSLVMAQRNCGTEAYRKKLLTENPALQVSFDLVEQQIAAATSKLHTRARDTFANELINIPVVIHIIYKTAIQNISDAQILSQIDGLNKDFSNQNTDKDNRPFPFNNLAANSRIKFCLAQVDPQGRRTNGIIRKYTNVDNFTADDAMKYSAQGGDNAWNSKQYLNIWVCSMGSRNLGYTSPPGVPAEQDGIVINYDVFGTMGSLRPTFNKGRTATHEIGHWLGLKHLWGDQDCGDDGVDDTPRQKSYNYGCPSFPRITTCSQDANGDMFMDFMDYSDDACMNMFTAGQKIRMRALFASGNLRNSFLVSFACDSTLAQGGPLPVDTIPVVTDVAAKKDAFKLYPNPFTSGVTIEYKPALTLEEKAVRIYNVMGIKVFEATITSEKKTFNVGALPSGIYIIRIGNDFASKLIRQ